MDRTGLDNFVAMQASYQTLMVWSQESGSAYPVFVDAPGFDGPAPVSTIDVKMFVVPFANSAMLERSAGVQLV